MKRREKRQQRRRWPRRVRRRHRSLCSLRRSRVVTCVRRAECVSIRSRIKTRVERAIILLFSSPSPASLLKLVSVVGTESDSLRGCITRASAALEACDASGAIPLRVTAGGGLSARLPMAGGEQRGAARCHSGSSSMQWEQCAGSDRAGKPSALRLKILARAMACFSSSRAGQRRHRDQACKRSCAKKMKARM